MVHSSIQADLAFLTSPRAAGRLSGTDGAAVAARYLARRLRALGLEPAGADGYFSPVLVPAARLAGPVRLLVGGRPLRHRIDFGEVAALSRGGRIRGPLLVMTEDRPVPEEALPGSVLLIPQRPEGFDQPGTVRAAAEAGVAALLVERGEPAWFTKTVFGSHGAQIPVLAVRTSVAAELAALEGAAVELDLPLRTESLPCQNVLGMLRGSDPEARGALALLAHYDHVGDDPGGHRFPGAFDNASGVATVLETARLLTTRPEPLPFPVLLALVTGEESGLWGTRALAAAPPVPIAAAISVDGMGDEPVLRRIGLGPEGEGLGMAAFTAEFLTRHGAEPVWWQGGTDAVALRKAGIPTTEFSQARSGSRPWSLHSPDDTADRLQLRVIAAGANLLSQLVPTLARFTTVRQRAIQ